MERIPKLGDGVIYRTSEDERKRIGETPGCNVQEYLPGIIVAVWGDAPGSCVNLKVIQDGELPDLWKTSVQEGLEESQWNYKN